MKAVKNSQRKYFPFKTQKGWSRLFAFLLVCLIVPLLLVGLYARPLADDCDYGIETHAVIQSGGGFIPLMGAALRTTIRFYNTWQGLYTSAFVLSLQPGIFGERLYALTPWLLLAGIFLCLWATFAIVKKRVINPSSFSSQGAAFLALLGTTVIALGLPSAAEGLYWFNGAVNYIPWIFATILNLALLYEAYHIQPLPRKAALLGASFLLSLLIPGGAQTPAFAHILLLLIATALLVSQKRYYSIASMLAALAGFAFMAVAPGNSVRQSKLISSDAVSTIIQSAAQCLRYLKEWFNLSFVAVLLLFTPFAIAVVKSLAGKARYRHPVWLPVLSYGVLCAMLCPPYYALSGFGASRLTNTVWIMFLALALLNYVYLLGWLDYKTHFLNREKFQIQNLRPCNLAVAGILCLAVLFLRSPSDVDHISNGAEAVIELANGTAAAYAAECDAQFAILNDDSIQDAELTAIVTKPKLLFLSNLNENPAEWPNTSCAAYYGKNSVRAIRR